MERVKNTGGQYLQTRTSDCLAEKPVLSLEPLVLTRQCLLNPPRWFMVKNGLPTLLKAAPCTVIFGHKSKALDPY